MTEWQPIETAPKDSTKIDLWMQIYASPRSMGWADSFRVPEAWWQESTKQWVHLHNGRAEPLYTEYVTHWMPLPDPPGATT